MCGIAGIVKWDGSPSAEHDVHAMCDAILHRGPDDEGVWAKDGAALGMRRLSIIDLATGHQPVHNEDRSIWVVFNGEIYNYAELRGDLRARGHRFYTTGDTETIVHLYEEFGDDAVTHLRGMFAFAVWDANARRLVLARDRLGIKPLFYARIPGGIAFASEVKALLQCPAVRRRLNWSSAAHLFTFLVTPQTESILEGVHKLDAAEQAVLSDASPPVLRRYWDTPTEATDPQSEEDSTEELRACLEEAVRLHLRSDVPLGAFLSGGVDSTAVVGLMSRLESGRIKTFSVGFHDERYDELSYARRAATAFGTDHHELVLGPQPPEVLEDIIWHLDEPFGDSSAIPTYLVSELAATHVKVVLSGDGGDELFGGYDKYVVEQRERRYERLPRVLRQALGAAGELMPDGATGKRFLRHLALDGARRYLDASTIFTTHDRSGLLTADAAAMMADCDPLAASLAALGTAGRSWLSSLQYCDLRNYLPLDILVKVDRMTMAHSIEARPVLLDHRLVECAARLPWTMKLRGATTKYLFKRVLRGLVPNDIIDRRKQGFAVPLAQWCRGPWRSIVSDILLSERCRSRGVFDRAYVEHVLHLNSRGRDMDQQIWTMVSFEQWCRQYLDGRSAAAPVFRPASLDAAVPAFGV